MGVDDMMVSFALSYIAGNIPQIKEWMQGRKDLQDKISKCYDRALKKWTVNDGIRVAEKYREPILMDDLKQLLSGEEVKDKGRAELVRIWIDELRNDKDCYTFILEHKSDFVSVKLDAGLVQIAQMLKEGTNEMHEFRQENNEQFQQVMAALQRIETAQGSITENELVEKIKQLLDGVVRQMIESLRLVSAKELLDEIEKTFNTALHKNDDLLATFMICKADALSLNATKEARDLYHHAYQIKPDDERLVGIEMLMQRRRNLEKAIELCNKLPESNINRKAFEVCYSDNPEQTYRLLPDKLRNDYKLRYLILVILGEKDIDTGFLFEDDTIEEDSELNFHNMNSWLYIMGWYVAQFKGELRLSSLQPIPPVMFQAFDTSKKLMKLVMKTEVRKVFAMAEANYCYWGYVIDGNQNWIKTIHQIERTMAKDQAIILNMLEVSMLVMAERFSEAFQIVATMRDDITADMADYVILMGFHANDMNMLEWVMALVKERPFKLTSSAALHIAFCVSHYKASVILKMLNDDAFENPNDAVVLRELCNLYDGRKVDVESLKAHMDGLTDDMTAYAAQVLANTGEAQMAYDLLQPKVDNTQSDIRQRLFIDVMAKLPEKHPELYKILIEKRKNGEPCDDEMLSLEYMLDTRVGDYENAFEAVAMLYKRRPKEESVLVNYLRMVGRFNPSELDKHRDEVIGFRFVQLGNVQQVYQIFLENKFTDIAIEVLYNYVKDSTDVDARAFYYKEAVTGGIRQKVYPTFTIAQEGLYAICDRADGERTIFKVDMSTEVGERLMGMKEGDSFLLMEDGSESRYTLSHIANKYGKLAAEILKEIISGANPHFKPLQIDMEHPLESLEKELLRINPDSANYQKDKQKAEDDYENGKIGIVNFVGDKDLIGDYYSRLFSTSKVYITPCPILEGIVFQGGELKDMRYVLDITGMLMLFEYQQKSGCHYKEKFIIPSTTYEFVLATSKNCGRLAMNSYSEALRGSAIVKYKEYIDMDLEIRMNKLLKWMDDNCEKEVSDKFLSLDDKGQKAIGPVLLMNTLTLMLKPDRCFISDDRIIESMMRLKIRVITTEVYIHKKMTSEENGYMQFLADCNFMGAFLSSDFIYNEYMKMERGMENKITYINQNASYNEILVTLIIQAAIRIAADAKDTKLASMTLTNMMVVMISSMQSNQRSVMVANLMEALPAEYRNTMMVRQCLQDAARINNVILLPGYLRGL